MRFGRKMKRAISAIFLLAANGLAGEAKVSWTANTEADLAGYKIYQGTVSRNYTQTIDAGNTTSFTISGLSDNVEYFFALTAYDTAGNESGYSAEISCVLGDQIPPTIVNVIPITTTRIQITFSEIVEPGSATNAGNYAIDNGILIHSASLQSDRRTVHLTTSEHQVGKAYTLTVSNVTDLALPANKIAAGSTFSYSLSTEGNDVTPPTITLANLLSATELNVYFSEPVDSTTATNAGNYQITPAVQILSARIGASHNLVQLTTAEHLSGTNYVLSVSRVADASPQRNVISPNSSYSYRYDPGDVLGPLINLVNVPDVEQVEVMFNEPVEKAGAELVGNYSINGGIQVLSAELDATGQIVRLQTSAHEPNHLYLLTVRNVYDVSPKRNAIAANSTFAYTFEPIDRNGPTIARVEVSSATRLRVIFNEMVDRSSAENARHYEINNGVQVISAILDVTGKGVILETTPHSSGQIYVLLVSEVLDQSTVGNEILPNSSYTYIYGSSTAGTGPTIVEVFPQSATSLLVEFSRPLDATSAQNAANYALNRGAGVLTARLQTDKTKVLLETTAQEANKVYILTISGVADENQNPILPNSFYSYVYEGTDSVGPLITLVKAVDAENVDVLFNERIAGEQAEQSANYAISGGIQVLSARLGSSHRVVHLQTTAHSPNKLYLLRLSNISDESDQHNPIAANSSYSYLYEPIDDLPPTIAMVRVIDAEHLQIVFNEPVAAESAGDKVNYSLNNDAAVLAATVGTSSHIVQLETSMLEPGRIYILMVNNVRDAANNIIAANTSYAFTYDAVSSKTAPQVADVETVSDTELLVSFNVKLNQASAEQASNYSINNGAIAVTQAALDTSLRVVRLRTSAHESGRIYVLVVSGIGRQDEPSVVARPENPFFYLFKSAGTPHGMVLGAKIIGETLVSVSFSQPVDRLSAENRRNYHISGEVTVLSAQLDDSESEVILETSKHRAGLAYTISISGVRNKSNASEITIANASLAYTYLPNLQVTIEGDAETNLSYLDIGKEYYLDRNYVITQVPQDLLRAQMVMTANNDKGSTDTRFMTIHLTQSAIVLVAYDSRANSVPNWLDARFSRTNLTLGVSDNAERLNLWQGYFPAGKLVLGGNNASGASGAKSMYIVLVQEPSLMTLPGGGQLEGNNGGAGTLPETVMLHPNYPNPFNPETTIAFDLPIEKQVRVIIYNILGREVKVLYKGSASAGQHKMRWNGKNEQEIPVAAGIYFCRLEAWENAERNGLAYRENYVTFTRKMTLLK